MLTIAKYSPSFVYSTCAEIRNTLVTFKRSILNKSELFFQMNTKYILFLTKMKGEGSPFWGGQA